MAGVPGACQLSAVESDNLRRVTSRRLVYATVNAALAKVGRLPKSGRAPKWSRTPAYRLLRDPAATGPSIWTGCTISQGPSSKARYRGPCASSFRRQSSARGGAAPDRRCSGNAGDGYVGVPLGKVAGAGARQFGERLEVGINFPIATGQAGHTPEMLA